MIKKINAKFTSSEFAKNTAILTLGTAMAQAVPILFYPALTRLFTPSDFGLLGLVISITAVLSVLSTGRYEGSILLTSSKEEGINIIGLTLIICFSFLITFFLILLFTASEISILFKEPRLKNWVLLCPFFSICIVIYNLYNEWCVRNKYFKKLASNKIINSSSTTIGKIVMGLSTLAGTGLLWGDLLGRVLSAAQSLFSFLKKDGYLIKSISTKEMRILARRFQGFPKFALPESLLDVVNSNLPIFFISGFFFPEEVGLFSIANNVLSIPASVISLAVMDVFRQRATEEWKRNGNCINIYRKTVFVLALIIVPLGATLFFIFPFLFALVLGEDFKSAGEYAKILLPNTVILFIFQVVSAVFVIANKLKRSFLWQIFSVVLTLISLLLGALVFKDIIMMLVFFVTARVIANLARFYMTFKYAKGIN